MDLDFDDQPAAPAARAGAKFKPKGRPQPKKKQLPLSTQSQDPVSVDALSLHPSNVSVSETIVTVNQSTIGTISNENVSGGVYGLRACTNVNSEGRRCADSMPEFPDTTPDSATFVDFVTRETDEVITAQTQRIQTGEEEEEEEEECHWNIETVNIVQEEGLTTAYEQRTGKLQPKPKLLDTVIEEPESCYIVDNTRDANQSELMVHVESRNDESNTCTTFYRELQEEEHNIPQVPRETVHGRCEEEHHVVSTNTKNAVIGEEEEEEETRSGRESKKGKSKRVRKQKTTSEEEASKPSEAPEKKRFKHSSRRQRNRTLEKELLETPDDEIRHLPFRDMLRLVDYRNRLEKKEAKVAPVVPDIQESSMNALEDNQYYSQGFDAEDEFGLEEGGNQETNVVKPDSPVNYQTYMNKTPRSRWSKQDTELFYEGIREFGSNLSMVQQLFPERTRQQMKLKFKSEERKFPLKLNEALSTRSKHLVHYHTVIKKLQQEAAAAREGEEDDEEEEEAETTTDVAENEEELAKSEGVKESESGDIENGVKESEGLDECEDNDDDDDDFWNSYKSDL